MLVISTVAPILFTLLGLIFILIARKRVDFRFKILFLITLFVNLSFAIGFFEIPSEYGALYFFLAAPVLSGVIMLAQTLAPFGRNRDSN